ncbi:hypothetical protein POSPLADRAFT_1076050 [Postia placenta MAD-698-R-SB12]|uniref:Uncharacterized protein n=1 Tax=Postia placenta MAD-698-R-SB12 TaxID=670580 RepID=A0A1X6MN56_9APHY|nr:hypothetical protein POSPLADRAFT_1076050 [Postia placenta MAD-698-R-SB12]OSX57861.1 hypothetical protein POSPLADRAFT_1076050 [Postia placenta MAD-698-R-SB12]
MAQRQSGPAARQQKWIETPEGDLWFGRFVASAPEAADALPEHGAQAESSPAEHVRSPCGNARSGKGSLCAAWPLYRLCVQDEPIGPARTRFAF